MKKYYPKLRPWGTNTRVIKPAPTKEPIICYTFIGEHGHVLGRLTIDPKAAAIKMADTKWPAWAQIVEVIQ